MPKRPRTKISGRRRNNAKNYLRKRAHALNLLVTNDNEREEERKKKSSFCSKLRNGKCSLQGGSLMLGGSPIQQTFNDRDTSAGALDGATNDQAAAGEEALKIRDDIATAAIEFDYDLIIEARPKLIQLQSVYGSNFGKEELVNAIKAQNEIESEWNT